MYHEGVGKLSFWLDVRRDAGDVLPDAHRRAAGDAAPRTTRTRRGSAGRASTCSRRSAPTSSAAGLVLIAANLIVSLRRGRARRRRPVGGATLEWATTSPPPNYNFAVIPAVSSPYPCGTPRTAPRTSASSTRAMLVLDHGHETPAIDGGGRRLGRGARDALGLPGGRSTLALALSAMLRHAAARRTGSPRASSSAPARWSCSPGTPTSRRRHERRHPQHGGHGRARRPRGRAQPAHPAQRLVGRDPADRHRGDAAAGASSARTGTCASSPPRGRRAASRRRASRCPSCSLASLAAHERADGARRVGGAAGHVGRTRGLLVSALLVQAGYLGRRRSSCCATTCSTSARPRRRTGRSTSPARRPPRPRGRSACCSISGCSSSWPAA